MYNNYTNIQYLLIAPIITSFLLLLVDLHGINHLIETFGDELLLIVQLFDVISHVTGQHSVLERSESFVGEPLSFQVCDDRRLPVEPRFDQTRRDAESDVVDETFLHCHIDD